MAHVYSAGLAAWDEDEDLAQRFGDDWTNYRRGVRRWLPRLRPWYGRISRLRGLLSERRDMCRDPARWFDQRAARQLTLVPAELHPSGA